MWSLIQYQNENRIEKHLLGLSSKNLSQNDPNPEKAINQRLTKALFKTLLEMKIEMFLMKNSRFGSSGLEKSMKRSKNKSSC